MLAMETEIHITPYLIGYISYNQKFKHNIISNMFNLYFMFNILIFGIIYLPSTKQIIYNDNNNVYLIKDAFTRKEIKLPIFFNKKELNSHSLIYFPVKHAKDYIKDYNFTFIDGYSAYIYAFDVFNNVSQGCFLKNNISMWDIYTSLPIANIMGLKIYNIENGEILSKLDFNLFRENFKAKNIWLICHPTYKDELMSILK